MTKRQMLGIAMLLAPAIALAAYVLRGAAETNGWGAVAATLGGFALLLGWVALAFYLVED